MSRCRAPDHPAKSKKRKTLIRRNAAEVRVHSATQQVCFHPCGTVLPSSSGWYQASLGSGKLRVAGGSFDNVRFVTERIGLLQCHGTLRWSIRESSTRRGLQTCPRPDRLWGLLLENQGLPRVGRLGRVRSTGTHLCFRYVRAVWGRWLLVAVRVGVLLLMRVLGGLHASPTRRLGSGLRRKVPLYFLQPMFLCLRRASWSRYV